MPALRAWVCEKMGWTFAEYDATDLEDVLELMAVWDAIAKVKSARDGN